MTLAVGSDEVLAQRAGAGDERAFGELARRYRGLIVFVTRRAPSGLSRDDLRQEALIGLFEACHAHDPSKCAFAQMAGACVRHRVWRAQLHARRAKHRVLDGRVGARSPWRSLW